VGGPGGPHGSGTPRSITASGISAISIRVLGKNPPIVNYFNPPQHEVVVVGSEILECIPIDLRRADPEEIVLEGVSGDRKVLFNWGQVMKEGQVLQVIDPRNSRTTGFLPPPEKYIQLSGVFRSQMAGKGTREGNNNIDVLIFKSQIMTSALTNLRTASDPLPHSC
jgi:hypothetical protein